LRVRLKTYEVYQKELRQDLVASEEKVQRIQEKLMFSEEHLKRLGQEK
jgi:hypothetical protein